MNHESLLHSLKYAICISFVYHDSILVYLEYDEFCIRAIIEFQQLFLKFTNKLALRFSNIFSSINNDEKLL